MEKKKVSQYIQREHLLRPHSLVLVALSGGADSVALLRLLLELGIRCEAAHCNFHLRGEESDRDEQFVRQLCTQLHVPLHVTHFNTRKWAIGRHISIEMAARELRYEWFEQQRIACGAEVIAVAHHRDDSVETLLLNLIRGTGINGLRGIQSKNGAIIRPLLVLSRQEILHYLHRLGQDYATDSTNLQDEFMRNKIRLHLIPLMQTLNPSVQESIMQTAHHLEGAARIYKQGIAEGKQRVWQPEGIHIPSLLKEPAPDCLLFELLAPLGFNDTQLNDMIQTLSGQSGKSFRSATWRVTKDRDFLLVEKQQELIPPTLHCDFQTYTPHFVIPKNKEIACLDADKLTHPLTLRRYQPGDIFIPFGMKGRKKVSDYMTDRKFSLPRKERQWVVCCGEDIVWLVNERTDNRFRVNEHTTRIAVLTCSFDESNHE